MAKFSEIAEFLNEKYPEENRANWDFTDGFLQGELDDEIKSLGVALELNEKLIEKKFDALILHHPPIFGENKKVTNPYYKSLLQKIPIYVLHSRIDKSGDMNLAIAEELFSSFETKKILDDGTIIIELESNKNLKDIIEEIKEKLHLKTLKTIIKKEKILRIAIHGGEGFNQHHVEKASEENIDLYLAGDLSHHLAESAQFHEISFIDIQHNAEQLGMKKLSSKLSKEFPDLEFNFVESKSYWSLE